MIMKEYVLNYYSIFKCIAGECKHTCCAGWKMNIDEQSLTAYKSEESAFSDALKKGINFKEACFKADKNKRCAFLKSNGLCELIINLGEKSLCQVCRDHPRFRSFFDDRVEVGLGFCCEESARIILSFTDKIKPKLINDDGKSEELDFIQNNVLVFREKALNIVQDRSLDINKRIEDLLALCNAQIGRKDFSKIIKMFYSFERLDKSWTNRLKSLKRNSLIIQTDNSLTQYAEQFLVNSLYRHLYDAEDTFSVRARAIACVVGWWLINSVFELEKTNGLNEFTLLVDVVRAYSAEVEYSQNNLDKLYILTEKYVKI